MDDARRDGRGPTWTDVNGRDERDGCEQMGQDVEERERDRMKGNGGTDWAGRRWI